MNDTRTVGHCNVAVAGNEVSLHALSCGFLACAFEERLVGAMLKSRTCHLLKNLVSRCAFLSLKSAENLVEKGLRHVVCVAVAGLYLAVGLLGVNAERNV